MSGTRQDAGFGLRRSLLAAQSPQLLLEFAVAGLDPQPSLALVVSTGTFVIRTDTLVIEGHDVATGLGVEPLQTSVMPPDVQAQHVAVTLKDVPCERCSISTDS